jgi:hypothetical protein
VQTGPVPRWESSTPALDHLDDGPGYLGNYMDGAPTDNSPCKTPQVKTAPSFFCPTVDWTRYPEIFFKKPSVYNFGKDLDQTGGTGYGFWAGRKFFREGGSYLTQYDTRKVQADPRQVLMTDITYKFTGGTGTKSDCFGETFFDGSTYHWANPHRSLAARKTPGGSAHELLADGSVGTYDAAEATNNQQLKVGSSNNRWFIDAEMTNHTSSKPNGPYVKKK